VEVLKENGMIPRLQMIDIKVVRAHSRPAGAKGDFATWFGRSRVDFTTKIHVRVIGARLLIGSEIVVVQTLDHLGLDLIIDGSLPGPCVLHAERGHDFDMVRESMEERNVTPVTPVRKVRQLLVAMYLTLHWM
jgi:hypothetical protein